MRLNIRPRLAAMTALLSCACSAWISAYFDLTGMGGTSVFVACFLLMLFAALLRPGRRELALCVVGGALFSVMRVLGYSYEQLDSYGMVLKSAHTLLQASMACLALAAVACCALLLMLHLLAQIGRASSEGSPRQVQRRLFVLLAGMIFLGSVPYLLLYAPGLNIADTRDQVLQYFGFPSYIGDGSALSDHHPVLLTILYGAFMRLGLAMGDPNRGQLLYSVLSMAAIACCYALLFEELRLWGLRNSTILLLGAGVALYPVLALYAFNMCKDVSAAPFVLLLVFCTLRMERTHGEALRARGFTSLLFTVMLALMLVRKSALYALLFALPFYLLRWPSVRRRLAVLTLMAAALFQVGYTSFLLGALGVVPGETREMLSIPFQQTARYLATYPDDITDAEREAVDAVLDIKTIAQRYDPRLSDPVKDACAPELTKAMLTAYAKAYLAMGLRHPGVYVDAWLNMIFGYFYPSQSNTIVCLTLNSPDAGDLTLTQDASKAGLRLWLHDFIYYTLRRLPGVGALFYVDTVTWTFLFLLLALTLHRGAGAVCSHMFLVGTLGISMLSPKSGEIRYILPILYALPALLGQALAVAGKEKMP